jgi:hypothetical protein
LRNEEDKTKKYYNKLFIFRGGGKKDKQINAEKTNSCHPVGVIFFCLENKIFDFTGITKLTTTYI